MLKQALFCLDVIGLIDSISYMAVSPSLIFYVLQLGGTTKDYGWIMSVFSFASFCGKPAYGAWVDKGGNKFRVPYLSSLVVSVIGALLYFLAVTVTDPRIAVGMIFVGRFLSGIGAANQALGYAYLASIVPPEMQTRTATMITVVRIVGMVVGPGINYFLDSVHGQVFGVPVGPLNSVGLLLAIGYFVAALVVYFIMPEPPEKDNTVKLPEAFDAGSSDSANFWIACLSIDILLPTFILFAANSAFQLIETALPPAASHGLRWGPSEASAVLGAVSIAIFGVMGVVMFMSTSGVSDTKLVAAGNLLFLVGGVSIYLMWTDVANAWQYILPVMISISGFPFIASPNRSNFTKAVMDRPVLESNQATMHAILSMFHSVAGFTTPGFVAAYVIRSPQQVDASADNRELTSLALYAPVLCALSLVGLYYIAWKEGKEREEVIGEGTPLVGRGSGRGSGRASRKSTAAGLNQAFRRSAVVDRRASTEIMGLAVGFDTLAEKEMKNNQLADWEELKTLFELDDSYRYEYPSPVSSPSPRTKAKA
ncbi:unnamed protein product [Cylindrotheca closterium]|uniref:Major facilitator superfamily (MFS) profile domain-containing protein n=1 Tax=Cylindrotheca closterium TaxID=2856 RepID=A0AAD2GEX8_9STRA|nr:unnamed protein product [Cylindrotheca closterium]